MATIRERLLASTIICGAAALTLGATAAMAQTTTTPPVASPGTQRPAGTAPDPARVDAPGQEIGENPEEARNQSGEPVTDDEGTVEAVVVTGSRIRRDPTNAPAPLIQLGREEVLASGEANIIDFLADIPALQTSVVPEDTTGSVLGLAGLSLLNLRNLGSARTLVLVDGRRHVGGQAGTLSVDVDTIPGLLIESTEVVTGGQSALYGADAVSGVVNFILRRNFEGIEVDSALAQVNQGDQYSRRVSALIGHNFLDDRLNLYAFAEAQKIDEVLDFDQDFRREAYQLVAQDADVGPGTPDGVTDVVLRRGLRDAFFARGGVLILSNQVIPSPLSDPDRPVQACATTFLPNGGFVASTAGIAVGTNCSPVAPENNSTFVFEANGAGRPFNFGTFQSNVGINRRLNIGGDGLNTGTEFGQGSRIPESENYRFQTGFNFDVTENLQLFGEAKYVEETNTFSGQPTFFQLSLVPVANNTLPGNRTSSTQFFIGNDNAFLPADVRARILANTRAVIEDCPRVRVLNAAGTARICPATGPANPNFGQQVGTVADPRAGLGVFGPSRFQENEREMQRYVLGFRGDFDRIGFVNNISYELGYTYGKTEDINFERALDVERFQFAVDAVRDVNNETGRGANSIVCRVQLLAARGITISDQNPNSPNSVIPANDPKITGCTPISLFGTDFRADADNPEATGGRGRPGLTADQANYVLAEISPSTRNEQQDLLGFVSGEIFEGFLPAGPIGVAVGYEYREETTSGIGRNATTGTRFLFLNTGLDFPEASYDVNELFGEVRIPLLRDLPGVDTLEVSGAFRRSEFSLETLGTVDTYSLQGLYRPNRDILFRATYGEATRIPNLGDLFDPGGQTFGNNLTDPCDALVLTNIPNPTIRDQQRANCLALLGGPGSGYDPLTTRIIYASGVPGSFGGNTGLVPEESRSYTASVSFTPRFIPRFSLVLDYYNIKIEQAIASPSIPQIINACVTGTSAGLNPQACALTTRNGNTQQGSFVPFQVINFLQAPVNFAAFRTSGIDFTARYAIDFDEMMGRNWGRIDYALRGNYLIDNEFFTNILDPSDVTEVDSAIGQPRVRFLQTITYSPTDKISVSWDWDYQTAQEIFDEDFALQDPDNRDPSYFTTKDYSQHDFTVRYDILENVRLRAGVVNAFDKDPPLVLGSTTSADNFDLFGRRFFIGANVRFGAAVR